MTSSDGEDVLRQLLGADTPLAPIDRIRPSSRQVPCLTVLWHADPAHIGGRAVLRQLTAGRAVEISRFAPKFLVPGNALPHPLTDPFISRRPLHLKPLPRGGLRLTTAGSKTRLVVDGEDISRSIELSEADLERGCVLLLAQRVVLLLHRFANSLSSPPPSHGLVGDSTALLELRREIDQVADTAVPVLLRGETGTGKELVARALHQASSRRHAPYIAINMASIPASLAAAELFGASKGAYTGSVRQQTGHFGRADGGTLFLDEIGEMPPEVQALLLRVLETYEIQPVGGGQSRRVNVRIIAATDADLEAAITEGRFRAPLFHRLSALEMTLPPLRQRRDDIGRLLLSFLRVELEAAGRTDVLQASELGGEPWLGAPLVARLAAFDWPGNVRQLRNLARQLVVRHSAAKRVEVDAGLERLLSTGTGLAVAAPATPARKAYRKPSQVTVEELVATLHQHHWHLKPTARALGISRASLYALIDRTPGLRKTKDLSDREIERARERHQGDLDAMAEALQVSREGLRQRLRRAAASHEQRGDRRPAKK